MPPSSNLKNAAYPVTVKSTHRDLDLYPNTNQFKLNLERPIHGVNSFIVSDVFIRSTQRLVEDGDKLIVVKDSGLITLTVPNGNYTAKELTSALNANSNGFEFLYDEITMRVTLRAPAAKKISISPTNLSKRMGFASKMIHSATNSITATAAPDLETNMPIEIFVSEFSDHDPICTVHFDSDGIGYLKRQYSRQAKLEKLTTVTVKVLDAFSRQLYETHACDFLFSFTFF